jgi:hypothetical protein
VWFAIQKQSTGTVSRLKELIEKSTSVIDSTHCINKAILCSGSNDIDHTREEVLNRLGGQIRITAGPILPRM